MAHRALLQTTAKVRNERESFALLETHKADLGLTNPRDQLWARRLRTDHLGFLHARFQQHIGGVPIEGAELLLHFGPDGRLRSADSHLVVDPPVSLPPATLQPTAANQIAKADLSGRFALHLALKGIATEALEAVAVRKGDEVRRSYRVRLAAGNPPDVIVEYRIDALTGAIIDRWDDHQTAAMTGSGVGVSGERKSLNIDEEAGVFTLTDRTRLRSAGEPIVLQTFDAQTLGVLPGLVVTSTSSDTWDVGPTGAGAAVDAHVHAGIVADYYLQRHAREGVDGRGGPITSTVHYRKSYRNAFFNGTQMVYGDGDGRTMRPLSAALDVVAHELTHAVTMSESKLIYRGQAGALNEALSDIFAAFIEHRVRPDPARNFILAEDVMIEAGHLRDMAHPCLKSQPNHVENMLLTTADNGGVHINSGVINNAMVLMTVGGKNDYSKHGPATGIGWEKSEALWYRVATEYLLEVSNFHDAAEAALNAAADLGFSEAETNIVECAFIATGVLTGKPCEPTEGGVVLIGAPQVTACPKLPVLIPFVQIDEPLAEQSSTDGSLAASVTARDNVGIVRVVLLVDDVEVADSLLGAGPYRFSLPPGSLAPGSRVLTAKATNVSGVQGSSSNRTYLVATYSSPQGSPDASVVAPPPEPLPATADAGADVATAVEAGAPLANDAAAPSPAAVRDGGGCSVTGGATSGGAGAFVLLYVMILLDRSRRASRLKRRAR